MESNPELFAVYNSIGYIQEGVYFKEPDCNACLKDLLKFLRTEDQHSFPVRRQLGNCSFVTTDLAPLIKQHCMEDNLLFDYVLRLLSLITIPPILLFKEQKPDDIERQKIYIELHQIIFNYKTDLSIDIMFWSVIAKKMLKILQTDLDVRQEEDKILLERMLILIRNILHVSSEDEDTVVLGDDNIHDKLLITLKKACVYEILIYICQTSSEHELAFHVLEIFSLIYRDQNAENLATITEVIRFSEVEKRKDVEFLRELKARNSSKFSNRNYSRFKETTYVIKNFKSIGNNDVICHKAISDINQVDLDQNKKIVRKAKNRQHFTEKKSSNSHSSSLEVKSYLRDLASNFISTSYNLLMKSVRFYLERSKSQENDETYFIWSAYFFMEFNRCSNAKIDFIMETLSKEYLHYLHCLIELYSDHIKTDKKNTKLWSKRLHNSLKAYKELIYTLAYVQSKKNLESSNTHIADEIKNKLFHDEDYRELLRSLLMVYDPIKMSDAFLGDLIESNHLFLKLLEYTCKKNNNQIVVKKKKKKIKRKKTLKNDKLDENNEEKIEDAENEKPELIWAEIVPELTNILQNNVILPKIEENPDLNLFNVISDESLDEQKLKVMKKINSLLFNKELEKSIALFREARNFFIDDLENTFGSFDIQLDEELVALQNILMNDFLIGLNKMETEIKTEEISDFESELSDEEVDHKYTEKSLLFNEIMKTYCNQKIIVPYCLALKKYETNSLNLNSCIIKMFHRIAYDCMMYCMFFQLSFFRLMQNVFNNYYQNEFYIELVKFGKFIINKFISVTQNNKNVYVELLFTKSNKEAYVVEYGHEETKEPPKKKKKTDGDNSEDEDLANNEDNYNSDNNLGNEDAATKFDKLFGNTKTDNFESTKIEDDFDENFDDSDFDDYIKHFDKKDDKIKKETQNNSINMDNSVNMKDIIEKDNLEKINKMDKFDDEIMFKEKSQKEDLIIENNNSIKKEDLVIENNNSFKKEEISQEDDDSNLMKNSKVDDESDEEINLYPKKNKQVFLEDNSDDEAISENEIKNDDLFDSKSQDNKEEINDKIESDMNNDLLNLESQKSEDEDFIVSKKKKKINLVFDDDE